MDAGTSAQAGHLFTNVPEPGRVRRTLCVSSRLSLRAVAVIPARLTCTQQVILYFECMLEYIHTYHIACVDTVIHPYNILKMLKDGKYFLRSMSSWKPLNFYI
jgi:hypothetical protein